VQEFSHSYTYNSPFPNLTLAYFLRYPNPNATHIISSDVIHRFLDPVTHQLHTIRLLLKRGSLPKWAPRGILNRAESWVLEESVLDIVGRELMVKTRNMDHRKIMDITELMLWRDDPDGLGKTKCEVLARVESSFGIKMVRRRMEDYSLKRCMFNGDRAREGTSLILDLLSQPNTRQSVLQAGESHPFSRLAPVPLKDRFKTILTPSSDPLKDRLKTIILNRKPRDSEPPNDEFSNEASKPSSPPPIDQKKEMDASLFGWRGSWIAKGLGLSA